MRGYIVFCVVCLQLGWTYGVPAGKGVGAFAYQDSAGNRYGGTYGLDDAQTYSSKGKPDSGARGDWGNFADAQVYTSKGQGNVGGWGNFAPIEQTFQQYDDFIPEYFNNLQNLLNDVTGRRSFTSELHPLPLPPLSRSKRFLPPLPPLKPFPRLKPLFPRMKFPRLRPLRRFKSLFDNDSKRAFNSNFENQKLAYNAARKAFDLTSNQAGYIPDFSSRFNDFGFNFMMPFEMPNSAYAGAAVGPGFSHQVAALNPENPREPNVNVMNRFSDNTGPGGKFYSVSSSSYSSSSNVNGRQETKKGAETLVNNNGVVTHYKVQN